MGENPLYEGLPPNWLRDRIVWIRLRCYFLEENIVCPSLMGQSWVSVFASHRSSNSCVKGSSRLWCSWDVYLEKSVSASRALYDSGLIIHHFEVCFCRYPFTWLLRPVKATISEIHTLDKNNWKQVCSSKYTCREIFPRCHVKELWKIYFLVVFVFNSDECWKT